MYSHDDVWLLIHNIPLMDYAKKQEAGLWRKFVELVSYETANAYSDAWNTTFTINKMAADLGSYKLLLNIWLQIEEALDDVFNSIDK